MKKLAIKGHSTRGKEVIELLEMMGGKNRHNLNGLFSDYAYYFIGGPRNDEICSAAYLLGNEDMYFLTLEEFLEKYPYKVGDKVKDCYKESFTIDAMSWSNDCETMVYTFEESSLVLTADDLLKYNDNPYHVKPRHMYLFNEHDIVAVESDNKKQKWICEYKSYDNDQLHFYKGTYDIYSDNKGKLIYDSFYDVAPSDIIRVASPGEITRLERLIDKAKAPDLKGEDYSGKRFGYKIPDGYEFDMILNGEIFLKPIKPKYPDNYDECVRIAKNIHGYDIHIDAPAYRELMESFVKLLICRDAYWKIAREEMGLGKPWDSTYGCGEWGYWIGYSINENKIYLQDSRILVNHILVFPTEEMRDDFFENFKDLIEQCKELL